MAAGSQNFLHVVGLLCRQRCVARHRQQLAEAENGVEGRSQFVAHARQELRLRGIGGFRRFLGPGQRRCSRRDQGLEMVAVLFEFALHPLALGDVLTEVDIADEIAGTVKARGAGILDPAVLAIAGAQAIRHPERLPAVEMAVVGAPAVLEVLRMNACGPARGKLPCQRLAGETQPRFVEVGGEAVRAGGPDQRRAAVGECAVVLLAFLQRRLALCQRLEQQVEAADQLPDFVVRGCRQGLQQRAAGMRHVGEQCRRGEHRRELLAQHATEQPPANRADEQTENHCRQQYPFLHRGDGLEGLRRWQHADEKPASDRNSLGCREFLDATRVHGDAVTLVAADEAVVVAVGPGDRHRRHGARLVRSGDDQTMLRSDDQITAGPAVALVDEAVEETRLTEIDDPGHGADDLPGRVADGRRQSDGRRLERPADDRPANVATALLEGGDHVVAVGVAAADLLR
ncbi:MAG: hypothetical protein AW07_01158 [Candidatus Accumulibacter sp. SK-11]|nr:MAG: hypothetical protein AW07_01158 [Candidatus Accumulibacter sp. SK-11]